MLTVRKKAPVVGSGGVTVGELLGDTGYRLLFALCYESCAWREDLSRKKKSYREWSELNIYILRVDR